MAAGLGFDNQDQIRLATATSEIARNAFRYARGGVVGFAVTFGPAAAAGNYGKGFRARHHQSRRDLAGRYRSETGMGMGIVGTRRLMDEFKLARTPAGPRRAW